MNLPPVPAEFIERMRGVFGPGGAEWAGGLHERVAQWADRWSLVEVGAPFSLSYNYVVPGLRADGLPVVLKLGFPNQELLTEVEALRIYNGRGICRLLESDEREGAFLLERLVPGTTLSTLFDSGDDDRATEIAARVFRDLWVPAPEGGRFPTVADWAEGITRLRQRHNGGTGPFDPATITEAERLFAELLPTQADLVLLHGDLHHYNILRHGDDWLAIDPKGVIGEAAYECGALLRNPSPQLATVPNPVRLMARRLDSLSGELRLDRERIRAWGIAQAVLSAVWTDEDNDSQVWREYALNVAEWLQQA